MSTSAELLQQQLAASPRKKPKGVPVPISIGVAYNVELQKMVRLVKRDIDNIIMPVVKSTSVNYTRDAAPWIDLITGAIEMVKAKWSSRLFEAAVRRIAETFVKNASNANEKAFKRDVGIDIFTDNQDLQDAASLAVHDNVQLITSIPAQYLDRVESTVLTNVRAGGRPSVIAKQLQAQFGITERRAKFIARDQVSKLNGNLAAKRQQAAGFKYFQWIDSHDERVRHRHRVIDEKVTKFGKGIYSYDLLPLSDKGVPIIPSEDYGCRCIARPVSQREVDENIKAGRTVKGVKR